ncbi:MAG: 2-dehydropantoate 2-reductase [Candidatus Omnitrophota bacterium]
MIIAVIGAGAIGSVVAAYLHKTGVDVVLVGRENQVNAIKRSGLKINGVRGEEIFRVPALTRLDKKYDLTIFTVKTQDLEDAYAQNSEFLLENSLILSTQNGVQADNILSGHFEKENMLSSIVMFGATYIEPGVVTFNFEGDWILGKPFISVDKEVRDIAEILKKAFTVAVSTNIVGMKWLKLFVNFNNCLPALIGKSMQETFTDMDFCKLSVMLLKEGIAVTEKVGIELVSLPSFPAERIFGLTKMPLDQAAGIMNKTLTGLSKEPLYGSILQSILRQKASEIDFINGEVVLLGKQVQSMAPLNLKVVDLVHRVERERRFFTPEEIKKEFSLN